MGPWIKEPGGRTGRAFARAARRAAEHGHPPEVPDYGDPGRAFTRPGRGRTRTRSCSRPNSRSARRRRCWSAAAANAMAQPEAGDLTNGVAHHLGVEVAVNGPVGKSRDPPARDYGQPGSRRSCARPRTWRPAAADWPWRLCPAVGAHRRGPAPVVTCGSGARGRRIATRWLDESRWPYGDRLVRPQLRHGDTIKALGSCCGG